MPLLITELRKAELEGSRLARGSYPGYALHVGAREAQLVVVLRLRGVARAAVRLLHCRLHKMNYHHNIN